MTEIPTTIPGMIKAYMDTTISHNRTMRKWLYLDVHEAMSAMIEGYKEEFEKVFADFAVAIEKEGLTQLKINDGTLQTQYENLRQQYDKKHIFDPATGQYSYYFTEFDVYKRGYENVKDWQAFIAEEFLPVLKELEEGKAPMLHHLAVLRFASHADLTQDFSDATLAFTCGYTNTSSFVPPKLRITEKECDSIGIFAAKLCEQVQQKLDARLGGDTNRRTGVQRD